MRIGETPASLVEDAADSAMTAAKRVLEAGDAQLEKIIVLIQASDVPAGEDDAASAATGFDSSEEFAVELMGHAVAAVKAQGVNVAIAPMHGGLAS